MIAVFLTIAAVLTTPEPRPVSDAERAAVAIVASYLASGPEAVWDSIAPESAMRKLDKRDGLREIAVRLGPRRDAAWELQTVVPSLANRTAVFGLTYEAGGDDVVVFDMKEERGTWRVVSIRTSAEPQAPPRLVAPHVSRSEPASKKSRRETSLALMIVFPALLVGILGSAMANAVTSRLFLVLSAVGVIGSAVLYAMPNLPAVTPPREARAAEQTAAAAHPFVPLAALDELRNAWAAGDSSTFERFRSDDPVVADVARQWRASLLAGDEKFVEAAKILDGLARRFVWPMAEVLRARMAYLEKREVDAAAAYERALSIGPGRDNLWLEAAQTLAVLGFDERAETYAARAAAIGTREAGVYYGLAVRAAVRQNHIETRKLLLTAWRLQPVERAQIIGTPVLWKAVRDEVIARELKLHTVEEASFANRSVRPLDLPSSIAAELSGDHLRLRAAGGEVDVPGGARIAPPHAIVIDAGAWRRRDEDEAMAAVSADAGRTAASFADPYQRVRYLEAAIALASRNRWPDIVAMTEGLPARDERVPVDLMVLRGQALARMGRTAELRPLVTEILLNSSFRRKKDPGMIRLVGELVAAMDDYDSAIALLKRANAVVPLPGVDERVVQLQIEKQLASSYAALQTAHFNILHPPEVTRESMETLAQILESEYRRLQPQWFPGLDMPRVTVNVLWWEDFRAYSGSDYIAGLFTNELFLPLAGLEVFEPLPVTIITHELTHAMLAAATENRAPRWFHEGLASHVEMRSYFDNAFQQYRDDRYLSVVLLDDVAETSIDPELVGEAYALGESMIRFIAQRYGKRAIVTMIDTFRAGGDTEQAIERATGLSLADLDREAREWGVTTSPTFEPAAFVRYDIESAPRRRR